MTKMATADGWTVEVVQLDTGRGPEQWFRVHYKGFAFGGRGKMRGFVQSVAEVQETLGESFGKLVAQ